MDKLVFLFCACFIQSLLASPIDKVALEQKFTEHRLDLLENGFNVFADEFIEVVQSLQQKVHTFADTNNELRNQLKDITEHDDELTETVKQQEKVISDLLWAVADMKERRTDKISVGELRQPKHRDKDELTEIEWTLFDLKYSTGQILEGMCLNEAKCSDWSEWSACSVDCGPGSSIRSRSCTNDGKFQSYCDPARVDTKDCLGTKCGLQKPQIKVMASADLTCPESFVNLRGYCLRFSGRSDNRNLANIICETDNAHLVTIDHPEKRDTVIAYLEEEVPIYMQYLTENAKVSGTTELDYIDKTSQIAIDGVLYEGDKQFVNWKGEDLKYFQWSVGEPRHAESNGDYCITVSLEDHKWYSNHCDETFYYVCEAPLVGS